MSERILVTCALPYVNNVPHLGNMVPILSADVYTRFLRQTGRRAIYICATDEHGTRTEMEARRAGLSPAEWCERMHRQILDNYLWFNVRFDHFGRTSSPSNHRLTQDIFLHLDKNGYIFDQEVEQLYCPRCGHFLPDTYVSGTCPICRSPDASGDQCDTCGHFLDPLSLLSPRCKNCGSEPEKRTSRHLFLDLPKLAPLIKAWVEAQTHWEGIIRNVPLGWIKEGLQPRCITRDLTWGIKVPKDGFENKVFYVWFDAPIGYIAATVDWAERTGEDWREWWKNSETKIIHFLGKDNVPFHTIMWPGSLMGADDGWNLPYYIAANEYLNYEGGQFSKSRGRGIFSSDVKELPFAPDVWRFYLMANRPEKKDVDFSWEGFLHACNSDLVGNIGNLAHRIVTFLHRHFGRIPAASRRSEDRAELEKSRQLVEKIRQCYETFRIREAVSLILALGDVGNEYFHRNEPWRLVKENKDRCGEVMHTAAAILAHLTWVLGPVTPQAAKQIRSQLGLREEGDVWEQEPQLEGRGVGPPKPAFAKADRETVSELAARFRGKEEEKKKLPPLTYTIDPEIDYFSYMIEFSGVAVKRRDAELERLKKRTVASLDLDSLRERPVLQAYEPLLAERDRGGRAVSVVNLIEIVKRSGKLPTINTLVDAYNLQSLKYTVVMGAYDRRAITGGLRMKVADGTEHFVPVTGREPEKILPGEWVIVDEQNRVVTKIVTKQSEAVAVTTRTTDVALCVQGNPAMTKEELRRIAVETCELIQRFCGGTWRIVNDS